MQKSGGVVEKEIVFSRQQDTISDSVSGLVLKESLAVVDIEVIEEETTVYNFEVEDDHTYFVTEAEVWVYNAEYTRTESTFCTNKLSDCDSFKMNISRNGNSKNVNFKRVGVRDKEGGEAYLGSDGSLIYKDENGEFIHLYKDEYGNELWQSMGSDMKTKGKFIVNNSEVKDGYVVKMEKDGKMTVISQNDAVKNMGNGSIVFVNGIQNSGSDATESLNLFHKSAKGKDVFLIYNKTDGFLTDSDNADSERYNTDKSKTFEASGITLRNLLENGKVGTLGCHSQGGAICTNAIHDVGMNKGVNLSDVKVATFGGFQHINDQIKVHDNLPKINAYINRGDDIPFGYREHLDIYNESYSLHEKTKAHSIPGSGDYYK